MAKKKAQKKPGPGRSTRNLSLARKQLSKDLEEKLCSAIAKDMGVNLFEMLVHFAKGDSEALGYKGLRPRFLKDGGVIEEEWITPEMRFIAVKEAIQYVAPKLSAVAISDLAPPTPEEEREHRPVTREDIISAIKNDPFFGLKAQEVIDITPEPQEITNVEDPFKEEAEAEPTEDR